MGIHKKKIFLHEIFLKREKIVSLNECQIKRQSTKNATESTMFEGVMRRSLAKKSCMIEKDPSRRQTMHGIPQFEKLFSSPKRKTISTQHLDHEVFNNNTKAMSFPRSTVASSAPRLEIEKRLSVIDNQVHQMKGHHRRNSSYGGHNQTPRKAETENRDENETDDLIAVTKQKINKENEEKQKEDDNIRHQLRKLTEQQTIEQTTIDQLRQDFLKLAPNKVQKPRIDAAYEKQKQKIKEKIASLERKKQTLEQKLSSNRSSEQLTMRENGSDYSFNQNSSNNSASGVTWSDDHQSETLAPQNVLHDSNLSLSKTTKSYSNQSLSD